MLQGEEHEKARYRKADGDRTGCPGLLGASPKDYPARPVTLIVPFAAGGGTDIGTRMVVKAAEKYFPKPMVVQNIDGGGSEVGVSLMVQVQARWVHDRRFQLGLHHSHHHAEGVL